MYKLTSESEARIGWGKKESKKGFDGSHLCAQLPVKWKYVFHKFSSFWCSKDLYSVYKRDKGYKE